MDRIKTRFALLLAAAAVASVFSAAPARADENCPPLPQAVCSAHKYVVECVIWGIKYGWVPSYCYS